MSLWKVSGTGMYFGPFYVEADDIWGARAQAGDILAGPIDPATGRRSYGTVECFIRDIERADNKTICQAEGTNRDE